MDFCDEREKCYSWFSKEYAGKIDIAVLAPAFKDVALKAWCARASLESTELTEVAINKQGTQCLCGNTAVVHFCNSCLKSHDDNCKIPF